MFTPLDQPRIVLVCLFIGVLSGVFYEFFHFLKLIFKSDFLLQILNGLWAFSSFFIYLKVSTDYYFPDFRIYMLLFILIGVIIYLLSFHKIIAFFSNWVYNKITNIIIRVKSLYDRPKEKKSFFRRFIRHDNATSGNRIDNSLSVSRHVAKKKPNRTFK